MNCNEIKSLLSAYHDQELNPIQDAEIREHLASCKDCLAELQLIQQISAMVLPIRTTTIIPVEWSVVAEQIHPVNPLPKKSQRKSRDYRRLLYGVAAVLLLVIFLIVASNWGTNHDHHEMTYNLQAYSEEFPKNPAHAQETLLSHYKGQKITIKEAARQLNYQPLVATGLPAGYSIKENYLLEMPCCLCLQTICERPDGSQFVVLEHAKEQSMWPSNLPSVKTECRGYPTTMTDVNGSLAVTCHMPKRNLTVIATKNLDEATKLIGQFADAD